MFCLNSTTHSLHYYITLQEDDRLLSIAYSRLNFYFFLHFYFCYRLLGGQWFSSFTWGWVGLLYLQNKWYNGPAYLGYNYFPCLVPAEEIGCDTRIQLWLSGGCWCKEWHKGLALINLDEAQKEILYRHRAWSYAIVVQQDDPTRKVHKHPAVVGEIHCPKV